jgi:hypothetical protein
MEPLAREARDAQQMPQQTEAKGRVRDEKRPARGRDARRAPSPAKSARREEVVAGFGDDLPAFLRPKERSPRR